MPTYMPRAAQSVERHNENPVLEFWSSEPQGQQTDRVTVRMW